MFQSWLAKKHRHIPAVKYSLYCIATHVRILVLLCTQLSWSAMIMFSCICIVERILLLS